MSKPFFVTVSIATSNGSRVLSEWPIESLAEYRAVEDALIDCLRGLRDAPKPTEQPRRR